MASKKKPAYSTQKPTSAKQELAVKAFVERGKVTAPMKTTRRQRKNDDQPMARLTVWLPEEALKALKRTALDRDTTVQEILADLVSNLHHKK